MTLPSCCLFLLIHNRADSVSHVATTFWDCSSNKSYWSQQVSANGVNTFWMWRVCLLVVRRDCCRTPGVCRTTCCEALGGSQHGQELSGVCLWCCAMQSYYAVAVAGCIYINGSNVRKAALTLQLPLSAADGKVHRA